MGKKSLLSSTSPKKDDSRNDEGKEKKTAAATGSTKKAAKTAPKKKSAAGAAASKKAAPVKKTAPKKKAVPVKKVTPKKKAAPGKKATAEGSSKAKAGVKPKIQKAASGSASEAKASVGPKAKKITAKKKPVSIKELLSKKYEMSVPEKQYTPPGDQGRRAEVSSPPFVTGANPEEAERIRRLLFKKFDMASSGAEPAPEPEKRSKDVPPEAVSAPARDENAIDTPSYPAMESAGGTPVIKLDSGQKAALIGILVLVVLFGLVVGASIKNTAKYYLTPAKGELEIWKGRFSPMGKKRFVVLSETPMPEEPKEVYGKNEIYPFIFESLLNQSDALLRASDMPDFELLKRTLNSATAFAILPESRELIQRRLSKINLMTLVYKADILADKDTIEDLASARDALEEAMGLNLDEAEKGLVDQKLRWVDERQAQLEQQMEAEAEASSEAEAAEVDAEAVPEGIDE